MFLRLQSLVKETRSDLVIVNAENAFQGLGLTPELAAGLFKAGVDVISSGNHIWQRKEILPLLDSEERLLRPENYPVGVPGKGHCLVSCKDVPVGVLNLQGRVNMYNIRCPFEVGEAIVRKLRHSARVIVVDFHAESPEEKEALGLFLDGSVSAVVGTHTHVQSADERILPRGTAFMTDLGMTGPRDGVIGMKREISLQRSLLQIPFKMEVDESAALIMGAAFSVDTATGRCSAIRRIREEVPVSG